MNEIGQRMRELRETSRLSQMEIARLCGTNQTTIARMEAGKTAPSVKILVWWADYFNVSMDYLTCRTDQPQGKLYEYRPQPTATSEGMKQFIEMCFDPASPFNAKLKETLIKMMEESKQ